MLGQKASAARRAHEARAMSPTKALRRALSRTADVLWDLALVTHGVSQDILDQDGVVDSLPANNLLLLLDGPDGAVGLAMVDRQVMTGLLEVQTILQVTQIPAEDRPLTQTDAAMMAPLLNGTLERLARYLDGHPDRPQFEGFAFGAMVEDARTAGLLLEAPSYRAFRVSIDLALGRRKGEILFVLPERPNAAHVECAKSHDDMPGPHEGKMKMLPVLMDAVLCSVKLSIGAAQKLKAGDLIPLPLESVDGVELLAGAGTAVAGGRLGQMNGMRAVRLAWPEGAAPSDLTAAALADMPMEIHDPGPALPEPVLAAPAPVGDVTPDVSPADFAEDLPDLPPMEFDTGDFDFDTEPAEGESGDSEFAASTMDLDGG
ncbi:FliM/FliN family flagellar motor switch protein [Citreicella sp. C3M06]|uniref:FliM/FliN family flagellar motor switch protein n=1 Tax=Citreicella sp. C3M06 TaxID=2841564 RepID=UPI00352D0FE3